MVWSTKYNGARQVHDVTSTLGILLKITGLIYRIGEITVFR